MLIVNYFAAVVFIVNQLQTRRRSNANMNRIATFDAYGTLIDFDLDGAAASIVQDRLDMVGVPVSEFINDLRVMQFQATSQQPFTKYRQIIHDTLEIAMLRHGLPFAAEDSVALMEAIEKFRPFPEVPNALKELKSNGYDLAIITNSDNDLIPFHLERLGVEFDYVVTAEQAGAYKPREQAFEKLFDTLPQPLELVTHVAQGWEYDIIPAKRYGVRRVWINRHNRPGSDYYQPYDELPDLSGLPALLS